MAAASAVPGLATFATGGAQSADDDTSIAYAHDMEWAQETACGEDATMSGMSQDDGIDIDMDGDEDGPYLVTEACMSQKQLVKFPQSLLEHEFIHFLDLSRNQLARLPEEIGRLPHLVQLTLGNNCLASLPKSISHLKKLVQLDVSNNRLTEFPSTFEEMDRLQMLYAGGNLLEEFPEQLFPLEGLKRVYLGGNRIRSIGEGIGNMYCLEILYLGGNLLETVPSSVGFLQNLSVLYLGDNSLRTLPTSLGELQELRILNLHNNELTHLPLEVVGLTELQQLSLRGNPLVTDFVSELPKEPLSLLEICARSIKRNDVQYDRSRLPTELNTYLDSARHCSNPECAGVYFTKGVKSVHFVDFCGRYRLPLLNYLCSPCHEQPRHPINSSAADQATMRRVLLTGYVEADMDLSDGDD